MASFDWFSEKEQEEFTIAYDEASTRLQDILNEFGVAIVTDVIDSETCSTMEKKFTSDLFHTIDVAAARSPTERRQLKKFRDTGSLKDLSESMVFSKFLRGRGMISRGGLPHGSFAWNCRLHPRVRHVFSQIFGTNSDSLATGLDNVFFTPDCSSSPMQGSNEEWLHVDQNTNTGLEWKCYQGILYIWPSNKERNSSTTVLWPRSHEPGIYDRIMQDEYARVRGKDSWGQLVKLKLLQDEANASLHRRAVEGSRRVTVPAGALLLWDSRLTHQGWREGPRLAMPVCWEPRTRRDEQALRRKLWMCGTGLPSSHSSSEGRVHGIVANGRQPKPSGGGEGQLPLLSSLIPWSVEPGAEEKFKEMQALLWSKGRSAKDNADRYAEGRQGLEGVIRREVLDSI